MPQNNNYFQKGLFHEEAFLLPRPVHAFETFRVWDGNLLNIVFHWERLQRSCKLLGIPCPDRDNFFDLVTELKKNYGDGHRFRIDVLPDGNMTSVARKFRVDPEIYTGVSVKTHFFDRTEPNAKYDSPMYKYFQKMQSKGIWEVVFTDRFGNITEGSRTNILFLKNKSIVIPKKNTYLEGTFLRYVLECWEHEIIEQDISVDSLDLFDGAVLTNSLYGIVPVQMMDDFEFRASIDFLETLRKKVGI